MFYFFFFYWINWLKTQIIETWGCKRNPSVLCFRKFEVAKKLLDNTGGGGEGEGERDNQGFPSKVFCLTVMKILVEEPFSVPPISGIETIYASEDYATIFR